MARQPFLVALDYPPTKRQVDDLLAVAAQPASELARLVDLITAETGFLTLGRLVELASQVFADPAVAEAVANTVYSVHPDDVEQTVADLKGWRQFDPKQGAVVTDERLAAVAERVKQLAQPYPALERRRKADRLARLAGPRCDTVDVLCDFRPVFDHMRERIEGLLPQITLRLQVTSAAGDPSVYEVRLSEAGLGQLADQAERAMRKVRVMATNANHWIPAGWLGRPEDGSP